MTESHIHEEIHELLADSPGYLFTQLARAISAVIASSLEPLSLLPQEYGLMRIISIKGPVMQQEFADQYGIDRTTVTALVNSLEERKMIERRKSDSDKRKNMLHLTPSGRKFLTRAVRAVNARQKEFLSPLEDEEWSAMKTSLVKLLTQASVSNLQSKE